MKNICKIGYIYCLYVDNKISYIGQTTQLIERRLSKHKTDCFRDRKKAIYEYIKRLGITKEDFYIRVILKPLMVSSIYNLNFNEMRCIKYCIDRGKDIFNNDVKTISYIIKNKTKGVNKI